MKPHKVGYVRYDGPRFFALSLSNGSDYNDSMQRQRVRSNDRRN